MMTWTMEQIFGVKTYETFKIIQTRPGRKSNFNTFPKRNKILKLIRN